MEKEKDDIRLTAQSDPVLQQLAKLNDIPVEVYSSDEDFDLPYEADELSDDLDKMVLQQQIQDAKKFYLSIIEGDEDDSSDLLDDVLDGDHRNDDDLSDLNENLSDTEMLRYLQIAMEVNKKMKDRLMILEQALLKKQQELTDEMIKTEDQETEYEDITQLKETETDEVVTKGNPVYTTSKYGIVLSDCVGLFFSQFSSPYFKDKRGFTCPNNYDTLQRKKAGIIKVSNLIPSRPWTTCSLEGLVVVLKKCLVEDFKNRPDFKSIYRWKEYQNYVKSKPLDEILKEKPFKFDWLKVATMITSENRSSSEYEKIWNLMMNPSYSKHLWEEQEDKMIMNFAEQFNEKNWELIAKSLGTNRSPFQVFEHYQTSLRNKRLSGLKWSPEEDERLKRVIDCSTYGNFISWKKVMNYFEDRNYTQIYNRYKNSLLGTKKGKFSAKEDNALITALFAHGMKYKEAVEVLGCSRSEQQIRGRVTGVLNLIKSSMNVGEFSYEEDELLIQLVNEFGQNWSKISKALGTRDRTQVRHRYRRLKNRLANPNFDLSQIDRSRTHLSRGIRARNKRLYKLIRKNEGGKNISLTQKKNWLAKVHKMLEKSSDEDNSYEEPGSSKNEKYMDKKDPIINYFLESGSSKWLEDNTYYRLDDEYKSLTSAHCSFLKAQISRKAYSSASRDDDHLKPALGVLEYLKSESSPKEDTSDTPAEGTSTGIQTIYTLPPNFMTCSTFLNLLSYCSQGQKIKHNIEGHCSTNKEFEEAKLLWKKRLFQLFLWPAILTSKDKKSKYK